MKPSLAIPTDNVYKFCAITGLVILITSMFLAHSAINTFFNQASEAMTNKATLELKKAENELSINEKVQLNLADEKIKMYNFTYPLIMKVLGTTIGLSICMMVYGFRNWSRKVQPMQDKLLLLQAKKLEKEISLLRAQE